VLLPSVAVRLRIVAFATVAELLGSRETTVERPAGTRVYELLDSLEQSTVGFEAVRDRIAVAVNGRLANPQEILEDDSEIALLPPVSGGNHASLGRLTRQPLDIGRLLDETAEPSCGAQLLFLGRVRSEKGGPLVTHLTYDAYETMATTALDTICRELADSTTGTRLAIVHRLGEVPIGEPSVAIVTVSPHREAAYNAGRTALERLKKEVPIWKREHFADGTATWREEERLATADSED
jgi:molybdopterin synthase catalytic subunit